MDLSQSLIGTAVEFDFHHIDVIRRFDDDVDTAAMGGALHFGIKAHHLEDDIHSVLKMATYTVQHIRGLFFVHQIVPFIYSPAQALPSKKPWEYRPKPESISAANPR